MRQNDVAAATRALLARRRADAGQAGEVAAELSSRNGRRTLTHLGTRRRSPHGRRLGKAATERVAVAEGRVVMSAETLDLVLNGNAKKGDVLGAARIAGIMAAKRTHELIPLCHPLALSPRSRSTSSRTRGCRASSCGRPSRSPARPASRWRR